MKLDEFVDSPTEGNNQKKTQADVKNKRIKFDIGGVIESGSKNYYTNTKLIVFNSFTLRCIRWQFLFLNLKNY